MAVRAEVCRRAFVAGAESVEGPFRDPSGVLVTVWVPIRDQRTTDGVLGMEIDARDWRSRQVAAAMPPVLLATILAVLLWISVAGAARSARMSGSVGQRRSIRRLESVLTAVAGIAVTLFVAWLTHEREIQRRSDAFAQLAIGRTEVIADELHDIRATGLEGLASFYENSVTVTLEEYQHFSAYLAKDPTVHAWEWIPAVPAEEKARFEADARDAGINGFEIWEEDADGHRTPAAGRKVYYPLLQVAPLAGSEASRGFDLGSDPVRLAAIEEAARNNLPSVAESISLPDGPNDRKDMLVFRPVTVQGRPDQLRGFAVAALRTATLLRGPTLDGATHLEFALWRDGGKPELLATTCVKVLHDQTDLSITRPICAFGKVFAVTAHAGEEFLSLYPPRAGGLTFLVGLVLTTAIVAITTLVLRRREELEQLVAVRTAALQESKRQFEQLAEFKQRLEERTAQLGAANTALNEFAYVVSHDLKAPLRAVSQLAHWVTEDHAAALDDEGKRKLDLMQGRIARMYNLIDGILQYSRIGRVDEERRPVDLDGLVREVIESLAPPPHIRVVIASPLPSITADRVRMQQVFQNLISNAIKYMDKTEGLVTIGWEEANGFRRFWVRDNGPGIDPKYHEKVFGIFQTLTARDQQESTGIGLAVVKKIVETCGGKVELQSQLGQGATFLFTLPA